jgi:excisionase family DNA binding protein
VFSQPTPPLYVSLTVAAERLGVSERTIRRRIADGSLAGYRFGPRLLRVCREDLDAQLRPIPTANGRGAA